VALAAAATIYAAVDATNRELNRQLYKSPIKIADSVSTIGGGRAIALGDVNGDGKVDAIIGDTDHLSYFENHNGKLIDTGAFTKKTGSDGIGGLDSALGDIDGDGKLDLIAGGNRTVYWFKNTGRTFEFMDSVWFNSPTITGDSLIGNRGRSIALGTDDKGRVVTVIIGNADQINSFYFVHEYGELRIKSDKKITNRTGSSLISGADVEAEVADINGDGKLDMVAGGHDEVLLFEGL
jgi:hypothetical protein